MRKGTLFDSTHYKTFIADRDRALERVHLNAQTDLSRILFECLDRVEKEISHLLIYAEPHSSIALANSFDQESVGLFQAFLPKLVGRIQNMRRAVYLITYAGELEAIGRATQKEKKIHPVDFKKKLNDAVNAKTLTGQDLTQVVWADLMNLRGKILRRLRLALVQDQTPKEILDDVRKSFPKIETYQRPPRELKPFREADKKSPLDDNEIVDGSFAPQEDWDLAVDAYTSTELPASRFDDVATHDPEVGYAKYNWELEQEMTDDFVNQVRSGQNDAANDVGIKEFVWVAILDAKTCEACCEPRNGKNTSEIEDMLQSGELDEDECDATSPPAHPNCRCQAAPVASTDEVEGPDWKSFNDWLES